MTDGINRTNLLRGEVVNDINKIMINRINELNIWRGNGIMNNGTNFLMGRRNNG